MQAQLPARYYRQLIEQLAIDGADPAIVTMARARWPALADPLGWLALSEVEQVCTWALSRSGRHDLGVRLGQGLSSQAHALVGHALLQCPSVDAAVRLAARHFPLLHPGFALQYRPQHGEVELWVQTRLPFQPPTLQLHLDAVLAATLRELRELAGGELPLASIALGWPRPRQRGRYRGLTAITPRFVADSVPGFRLRLPLSWLQRPRRCDPTALAAALAQLDDERGRLCQQLQLSAWLRMLLQQAEGRRLRAAEIAALLGISSRSLSRRLAAEGCDFRQLALQIRIQRASAALVEGQRSVAQIGATLGYGDASNFSRALRRQLGRSPRALRTPDFRAFYSATDST